MTWPKFFYKQKVKVIKGFYRGRVGVVIKHEERPINKFNPLRGKEDIFTVKTECGLTLVGPGTELEAMEYLT